MSILEVPEFHTIDFEALQAQASDMADTLPVNEVCADRPEVEGLIVPRKVHSPLVQMGVSVERTKGRTGWLHVHLPHMEALAPIDSPIDRLSRYGYMYPGDEKTAIQIWRRTFSQPGPIPTLTMSLPLRQAMQGTGLDTGPVHYTETAFRPTGVINAGFVEGSRQGAELFSVARGLLKGRMGAGAHEIYHEGRTWKTTPQSPLEPVSRADFLRRELLMAAAIGIGRQLAAAECPAPYTRQSQKEPLSAAGIAAITDAYFADELTVPELMYTLGAHRAQLEGNPQLARNHNTYNGPMVQVGDRWMKYPGSIAVRLATQIVRRDTTELYTVDELAEFNTRANNRKRQHPQAATAVPERRDSADQPSSSPQNVEPADRPPEAFVDAGTKAMQTAYRLLEQGRIPRAKFLEICRLRAEAGKGVHVGLLTDTLFSPLDEERPDEDAEQRRAAITRCIDTVPGLAGSMLYDAAQKGHITNLVFDKAPGDMVRMAFERSGQQFTVNGRRRSRAASLGVAWLLGAEVVSDVPHDVYQYLDVLARLVDNVEDDLQFVYNRDPGGDMHASAAAAIRGITYEAAGDHFLRNDARADVLRQILEQYATATGDSSVLAALQEISADPEA